MILKNKMEKIYKHKENVTRINEYIGDNNIQKKLSNLYSPAKILGYVIESPFVVLINEFGDLREVGTYNYFKFLGEEKNINQLEKTISLVSEDTTSGDFFG
jgi:wobble nucleotide-excising tRNase